MNWNNKCLYFIVKYVYILLLYIYSIAANAARSVLGKKKTRYPKEKYGNTK